MAASQHTSATGHTSAARIQLDDDAVSANSSPGGFIQIRGLSKSYGATRAVDDLDLDIPRGQFLVLLGPSGCGKTTTMRCLVGLEDPERGTIRVGDQLLFDSNGGVDVPPNKRNMGMVFQSYALWPHKSVSGNVAFPLRMKKVPKSEAKDRTAEALRLVGLDGFEDRKITTLSGGQMQRVALARSLVMDPTILLLDEPLSNLDAKLRVYLRHELKEIQQRIGVTTVYVTHDQEEALGLADRILVLRDGVIAQDAEPEELYLRPATPFVADFLGMSNQFPVQVESHVDKNAVAKLDAFELSLQASDVRKSAGRTAQACFRPESVSVVGGLQQTAGGSTNALPGQVLSCQYQGSRLRYHIVLDDGPTLFADASADLGRLQPGSPCTAIIHASDVLLLDRENYQPMTEAEHL